MGLFNASVMLNTVRLDAIRRGLRPSLRDAVEEVGQGAEARAKAIVPVRTGALQRSIGHDLPTPTSVRVFATAPYAKYVEFGVRNRPPHPFLSPAAEWARQAVREIIRERIGVLVGQ